MKVSSCLSLSLYHNVCVPTGELVVVQRDISRAYLRSWFFIDVAACLPVTYVRLLPPRGRAGPSVPPSRPHLLAAPASAALRPPCLARPLLPVSLRCPAGAQSHGPMPVTYVPRLPCFLTTCLPRLACAGRRWDSFWGAARRDRSSRRSRSCACCGLPRCCGWPSSRSHQHPHPHPRSHSHPHPHPHRSCPYRHRAGASLRAAPLCLPTGNESTRGAALRPLPGSA